MSIASEHERMITVALGDNAGLSTGGSRYGMTCEMAATWAAAAHQAWIILGGCADDPYDEWETRSLESFMSWTVNDSPEPALLVSEAWYQLPRPVKESLGRTLREVKRMAE